MKEMWVKSRGKKRELSLPSVGKKRNFSLPYTGKKPRVYVSLGKEKTEKFPCSVQREKTENFRFFPKGRKNYIYKYI